MREYINIVREAIEFEYDADKVIADLTSHDSMVYTKLAQKVQRIEELEAEIKQLKSEVKSDARVYVADLFKAADVVRTRVVKTMKFIFTLSKDPKPTETVQHAKVIAELEKHLTPELILMLNGLREQFKTVTQKEPSLKITPRDEVKEAEAAVSPLESYSEKLLSFVNGWASGYDDRLDALKAKVA